MSASSKEDFNVVKAQFVSDESSKPILLECFTQEKDEREARDRIDSIDSRIDSTIRIKRAVKKTLPKALLDSIKKLRN